MIYMCIHCIYVYIFTCIATLYISIIRFYNISIYIIWIINSILPGFPVYVYIWTSNLPFYDVSRSLHSSHASSKNVSQGRANDWHWQWTLGIFWVHLGHRNHRNELVRSWQILTGRTRWQGDKVWFAQFARLAPLLWGLILVIIQLLSLGLNRWADVVQTRNRGRTGGIRQAGNGWYDDLMTWKAVFRVQKSGIF